MTKKVKPKQKRINYKKAVTELAECVVFAVKFLDTKSGGAMRMKFDDKGHRVLGRWQDTFFDALDNVGFVVDRDEYWKAKAEKANKRRRK